MSTVKFFKVQIFAKEQKCLYFGQKNPRSVFLTKNGLFEYFWEEF